MDLVSGIGIAHLSHSSVISVSCFARKKMTIITMPSHKHTLGRLNMPVAESSKQYELLYYTLRANLKDGGIEVVSKRQETKHEL